MNTWFVRITFPREELSVIVMLRLLSESVGNDVIFAKFTSKKPMVLVEPDVSLPKNVAPLPDGMSKPAWGLISDLISKTSKLPLKAIVGLLSVGEFPVISMMRANGKRSWRTNAMGGRVRVGKSSLGGVKIECYFNPTRK